MIADFVRWRLADCFVLEGFYDDDPQAGSNLGLPQLGSIATGVSALKPSGAVGVIALGTYLSWCGCRLLHELQSRNAVVASLISPTAHISPSASIGPGALVLDGTFIGARARIGPLLTANAATVIEHDTELGMNVMLGSGATIAGFAKVADHCFIGTNATVLPKVSIGLGTLLGAGSTATRTLPGGVIAIGAPARPVRAVGDDDEVPSPARIAELAREAPAVDPSSEIP